MRQVNKAVGGNDRQRFDRLVRALLLWGLAFGTFITCVYALFGAPFAGSFSTDPAVVATTLTYLPWAVGLPLIGVTSYVYDGIYIVATWTPPLLITMFAAFATYALVRSEANNPELPPILRPSYF